MLEATAATAQESPDQLYGEITRTMRTFRYAADDPRKAADAGTHLAKAEELLGRLADAAPDHPRLADAQKLVQEGRTKLAATLVTSLKRETESDRKFFERHFDDAMNPRRGAESWELAQTSLGKGKECLERLEQRLASNEAALATEPGQAFEAEIRAYLADANRRLAEAGLVIEARRMIHGEDAELSYSLHRAVADVDRALDDQDVDRAVAAHDAARKLAERLRDEPRIAAVPIAQEVLARCDAASKRYETEMKPIAAARMAGPIAERARRAVDGLTRVLDSGDAARVARERASMAEIARELEEWTLAPEAAEALAALEAAQARAEAAFPGTAPAEPVHTPTLADRLPRVELDFGADAAVQRHVQTVQAIYRMFRDDAKKAEETAARIDLANGNHDGQVVAIVRNLQSDAQTLISRVREAEREAKEIAALAASDPVAKVVEGATPDLVKAVQGWKARHDRRTDAALAISRASSALGFGVSAKERAQGGVEGAKLLADALRQADAAEKALAPAFDLLGDERAAAEAWHERIVALRTEATSALKATCVGEGRDLALQGWKDRAEELARILQEALPDAPESAEIAKLIGGAFEARAATEAEIAERQARLDARATEAAAAYHARYDAWRKAQPIEAWSPAEVLRRLPAAQGTMIAFPKRWIVKGCHDGFDDLTGGVWHVTYAPEVREALLARAAAMDALSLDMAKAVHAKHGVPLEIPERYMGRFGFEEVEIVCEVVGQRTYTPQRAIKDATGRVIATFEDPPYPVPAVVIRAVRAKRCVVVPGAGTSLDGFDANGILP